MKKIIKSTFTIIAALIGFIGGIVWGFKTNWNEPEPIILLSISFIEIVGFSLIGRQSDEQEIILPIINTNTNKNTNNNTNNNTNSNSVTVNINNTKDSINHENDEKNKALTKILFIDDKHTEYKMVSILKKAGWIYTKSIKDVTDLDDSRVMEANIIFVDINGVGITLFEDQGLGLASALKKKYPNKKIILYSAENTGDRFHKALREVDDCLPKDAEPYQFINLIESM